MLALLWIAWNSLRPRWRGEASGERACTACSCRDSCHGRMPFVVFFLRSWGWWGSNSAEGHCPWQEQRDGRGTATYSQTGGGDAQGSLQTRVQSPVDDYPSAGGPKPRVRPHVAPSTAFHIDPRFIGVSRRNQCTRTLKRTRPSKAEPSPETDPFVQATPLGAVSGLEAPASNVVPRNFHSYTKPRDADRPSTHGLREWYIADDACPKHVSITRTHTKSCFPQKPAAIQPARASRGQLRHLQQNHCRQHHGQPANGAGDYA